MKGLQLLGPRLWGIGASDPGESLEVNSYLLKLDEGFLLVDTGPALLAPALIEAARELGALAEIRGILLLDDSPFAASGLPAWKAAGFAGPVLGDWRTVAALALAGLDLPFRELRGEAPELLPGAPKELRLLWPSGSGGSLVLLHPSLGYVFTGRFASSRGPELPCLCEDPSLEAQRRFMESFGYGPAPDPAELGELGSRLLLCPRFGSAVPQPLAGSLLELATGPEISACRDSPDDLQPLMRELNSLRSSNYELREAMVSASDAALRDPATLLYARSYAESFVQALLERQSGFAAAFLRVDRIKDLNRSLGPQAVDGLLMDLARIAQEALPEAFLFRWVGPVLLLVLQEEGRGAYEALEGLRSAIAAERRLAKPVTVSIALVRGEEAGTEGFGRLHGLARERLRLLDRRGGDAVLDKSDIHLEDRALVLALDANELFLDFLVDNLEEAGFRTLGASKGGRALEIMDSTRPELVIADLALPQFDAFQIRARMRASSDLNDIPFILLARSKTDEVVARAQALGIRQVFQKPISILELLGLARGLLERRDDGA